MSRSLQTEENGIALSEVPVGTQGTVVQLDRQDAGRLRKLLALGLLPGVRLEVVRVSPAYVIRVGRTQYAIDAHLARGLSVQPAAA